MPIERLTRSFVRVLRGLAESEDVARLITALDAGSDASNVSAADALNVLDFPDEDMQRANIASVTSLSKAALLERAAFSPDRLSDEEISLLKKRYWLDLTAGEADEAMRAESGLLTVSETHPQEVATQLTRARSLLCELNEELALQNALMEEWQRQTDAYKQHQTDDVRRSLASARPWIRQMWEEDNGKKYWGFAAFLDPDIRNQSDYKSRRDALFFHALEPLGCGDVISAKWHIEYFDWPEDSVEATGVGEDEDEDEDEADDDETDNETEHDSGEENAEVAHENEDDLVAKFQQLRKRFRRIRFNTRKRLQQDPNADTSNGGIPSGILDNTFLVMDQACADSLRHMQTADSVWVWAVDPDYKEPTTTLEGRDRTEPAVETGSRYRGYLRVRLQQLLNHFFEARRFDGGHSMADLWAVAQDSVNKAFVSVNENEQRLFGGDRFVGTALRPAGPRPSAQLLY